MNISFEHGFFPLQVNVEVTKEKVMTEDEMAGWHHQLDGHEFE